MIRVAVSGACGRMGQTVCAAVEGAPDMELVGRADPQLSISLPELLERERPEVVVDFTQPDVAMANTLACVRAGAHAVVGTTGFDIEQLAAAQAEFLENADPESRANILVAPNFAVGAVLMMRFAEQAAAHMQGVEIIELHHPGKLDAPSGTAKLTAERIVRASAGEPPKIHSVRLPGVVANQEVIFGDLGQTLTIRHDTTGRESFMPGVLLAVRAVGALEAPLTVGLESLLFGTD